MPPSRQINIAAFKHLKALILWHKEGDPAVLYFWDQVGGINDRENVPIDVLRYQYPELKNKLRVLKKTHISPTLLHRVIRNKNNSTDADPETISVHRQSDSEGSLSSSV